MSRIFAVGLLLGVAFAVSLAQQPSVPRFAVAPPPSAGSTWDPLTRVFTPGDGSIAPAWSSDIGFADLGGSALDGLRGAGWLMGGNVPQNNYRTALLGPVAVSGLLGYGSSGLYVWRPSVAPDGTIYFCTAQFSSGVDGRLVALNPNASPKWNVRLTTAAGAGVWCSATPAIDAAGNVYVAWAHDINFGSMTALAYNSAGTLLWRNEPQIELENAQHMQGVVANGAFYVTMDTAWYGGGDPDHRCSVLALDTATGNQLWRWVSPNLDTYFDGPAIGSDGAVYVASASNAARGANGWMYRLLPDGNLDWSLDFGPVGMNCAPALDAENDIYLGDLAGVAWKISHDGAALWTHDTQSGRIYCTPALADGRVLVGAANAGLHILDPNTGTLLTRLAPNFYPMNKATDRAGNIYFYCFDGPGTVFAFGRAGRQWFQSTTGSGVSVNGCIVGADGRLLVGNSQTLKGWDGPPVGDLNCDGVVDFADINAFVLALSDPAGYAQQYPNCAIQAGDIDGDGAVNFADINPFVALLAGK